MKDYRKMAESRFNNWSVIGQGAIALFYPARQRTIVLCEDETMVEIAREFCGRERNQMRLDVEPTPKPREGFV